MSSASAAPLGLGIGWRPELAVAIDRRRDLGFVELVAESLDAQAPRPDTIARVQDRGVQVVLHGLSLSLGSATPPDARQLDFLAQLAERFRAPIISEHIAFVRGGGVETGHLLPVPRTREMLDVLIENIQIAQAALPVPLALENISSLIEWPDAEMDEAVFLTEVLERTGARLLLDVENVYANSLNHGFDAIEFLARIPLDRIAYVHVAGGMHSAGVFHDTHAHDLSHEVLDLVSWLCQRFSIPGVMLERDDHFPSDAGIHAELDRIAAAMATGQPTEAAKAKHQSSGPLHVN